MLGKERKLAGFNKIRLIIPAILVMLSGIVMLVSPEQPENACCSMLLTPLLIVTLVSPEQP